MARINSEEQPQGRGGIAFLLISVLAAAFVYSEADKSAMKRIYEAKISKQDSVIFLRDSTIQVLYPKATLYDSEQVRVQAAKDHIKELVNDKIKRQK